LLKTQREFAAQMTPLSDSSKETCFERLRIMDLSPMSRRKDPSTGDRLLAERSWTGQ
jgi:hypothetical protein